MTTRKKSSNPPRRLTYNRLRLLAILSALAVAALAVGLNFELPAFWAFLGVVIIAIFGQAST